MVSSVATVQSGSPAGSPSSQSSSADYNSTIQDIARQIIGGADPAQGFNAAQTQFPDKSRFALANDLGNAIYGLAGPSQAKAAQALVAGVVQAAKAFDSSSGTQSTDNNTDPVPAGVVSNVDTATTSATTDGGTLSPAATSDAAASTDVSSLLSQYGMPNGEGMAAFDTYLKSMKATDRGKLLVEGFADMVIKGLTFTNNGNLQITDGDTARAYAVMKKVFKSTDVADALAAALKKNVDTKSTGSTSIFSLKNKDELGTFATNLQGHSVPNISIALGGEDKDYSIFTKDLNKSIHKSYSIQYDFNPTEGAIDNYVPTVADSTTVQQMLSAPSGASTVLAGLDETARQSAFMAFAKQWKDILTASDNSEGAKTQAAQYAAVDQIMNGADPTIRAQYIEVVRANLAADSKFVSAIKKDSANFDADKWSNVVTGATYSASAVDTEKNTKFAKITREITGKDFSDSTAQVSIDLNQAINDYSALSTEDKKAFQNYIFDQFKVALETHSTGTFQDPDIPYWLRGFEMVKQFIRMDTTGDTTAKDNAVKSAVQSATGLQDAFKKVLTNAYDGTITDSQLESALYGACQDTKIRAAVDTISTGDSTAFSSQIDKISNTELRSDASASTATNTAFETAVKENNFAQATGCLKSALLNQTNLEQFGSDNVLTAISSLIDKDKADEVITLIKGLDKGAAILLATQTANQLWKRISNQGKDINQGDSEIGIDVDPRLLMMLDALKNTQGSNIQTVLTDLKTKILGKKDNEANGFYRRLGDSNFNALFDTSKKMTDLTENKVSWKSEAAERGSLKAKSRGLFHNGGKLAVNADNMVLNMAKLAKSKFTKDIDDGTLNINYKHFYDKLNNPTPTSSAPATTPTSSAPATTPTPAPTP